MKNINDVTAIEVIAHYISLFEFDTRTDNVKDQWEDLKKVAKVMGMHKLIEHIDQIKLPE